MLPSGMPNEICIDHKEPYVTLKRDLLTLVLPAAFHDPDELGCMGGVEKVGGADRWLGHVKR